MEIFRQAEVVTRVMASTTDMMERPAKRPANSVLISRRSAPIRLPTWQRGLSEYLARQGEEETSPSRRRSSASKRQPVLEHWPERVRQDVEAETEETAAAGEGEGQDAA